jgi:hypothetical protein
LRFLAVQGRHLPLPASVTRSSTNSRRPPHQPVRTATPPHLRELLAPSTVAATDRKARCWRNARPGVHRGGWVTFADGAPPVHVADAERWPAGDVLVLEAPRAAPHYREHGRMGDGARVGLGSLAAMADAADARTTGLHSFAVLVGLLTLAPMAACYLVGLLG